MMSTIGQIEKRTQAWVIALFRDRLGYDYLGDWMDRPGNANIEPDLLRAWLRKQGVEEALELGRVQALLWVLWVWLGVRSAKIRCLTSSDYYFLMSKTMTTIGISVNFGVMQNGDSRKKPLQVGWPGYQI